MPFSSARWVNIVLEGLQAQWLALWLAIVVLPLSSALSPRRVLLEPTPTRLVSALRPNASLQESVTTQTLQHLSNAK